MIPRLILSRACSARSLLHYHVGATSEKHGFNSLLTNRHTNLHLAYYQSRNFTASTLRNSIFNFWDTSKDGEVVRNVNDTYQIRNGSVIEDQASNATTMSSSVDQFPSSDNLIPNIDGISNDAVIQSSGSLPDATTFADLGLGGSILPHKLFQDILEFLHTTAGLEWIPAIAVLTVVIRTLTLPCFIAVRQLTARSSNLFPQTFDLQQAIFKAQAEKNTFLVKKAQMEYQTFIQENKINPFRALIINSPNMIAFSSMFFCLRQMCNAQVPSLMDGGMFWFQNLSIPDPYMILPVASCLSMSLIIKSGAADSEIGPAGNITGIRKALMWLPVISIPFLIYQPSAIFAFWITSNMFSYLLMFLFRNKAVLKFFRIPEMVKHDASTQKKLENAVNPMEMFRQAKQRQKEARQLLNKVENYKKEMERLKELEKKKKE